MANRDSTLKARKGRKVSRAQGEGTRGQRRFTADDDSCDASSDTAIEIERTRLMKAEAILGCIAFALVYSEWRTENGAEYANAVQVARELLQDSITRLDFIAAGRRKAAPEPKSDA